MTKRIDRRNVGAVHSKASLCSLLLGLGFVLAAQSAFAEQMARFRGLGDLPSGVFDSRSFAISANGSVVVGYGSNTSGQEASRWTVGGGMVGLGETVPVGEVAVPEGLTDSAWKSIRQEYERHRHAAVAVDGGYRARNPGQQWLTHFDGRGFSVEPAIAGVEPDAASWRWGLKLQSYGFPGNKRAVSGQAKMTAQNDRLTYDWDEGLLEWFVNDRRGLEHGFTLANRPPGAGDPQMREGEWLELRLVVRGGLRAQGHAGGRGVSFVNEQGHTVVNYAGLKVWDADHRQLPARIHADAKGLRLTVDERRARYPLTIDPIAQQAYLKASNTQMPGPGLSGGDGFGRSVAVSGDTVVVGAVGEDSNATGVNGNQSDNSANGSGAAYVFVKGAGGIWSQQAYLKASNSDAHYVFGRSVAVSGDTVVVGAYGEDSNATGVDGNEFDSSADYSGAAYVFVRDGGGVWSQQAYLKASNTDEDDVFGFSVAVSGDTVVVGALQEDSNATGAGGNQADNSAIESGAAYVFVRDGGGVWSQQAYLKASNTDARDEFGFSVGVSGDTVVVGALQEDSNATGVDGDQAGFSAQDSGAAYVFVRDGGGIWSQQAYLKASNTDRNDGFGLSVAVSGDTLVVGASGESSNATGVNGNQADNSALSSGAAYVFVRDGGNVWSQQAYLKASNTDAIDRFGTKVAVSGDTLVAGAWGESSNATGVGGNQADNSASQAGAAYVFVRDGGGVWSQQAYLKASNTDASDRLGLSVAVSGNTVVVGAYWEDSNATGVDGDQADNSFSDSGAAYVFFIPPPIVCGDGVVEVAEQCDDGNTADSDGCSSTCTVEPAFACVGEPSICSPDCNTNGIPDELDITNCTGDPSCSDCNGNTIPDECEADCDGDGIPNECDPPTWIPTTPTFPTTYPHGAPKNRYISFIPDPASVCAPHNYLISHLGSGQSWFISSPRTTPISVAGLGLTYLVSNASPPMFHFGAEPIIHVSGCMIAPNETYEVQATIDGVNFSAPLLVSTAPMPTNSRWWADIVGSFSVAGNGTTMPPTPANSWEPPNGSMNGFDITAVLQGTNAVSSTKPHITWTDIDGGPASITNRVTNGNDVLRAVNAFATSTGREFYATDHPDVGGAGCPICDMVTSGPCGTPPLEMAINP